jgi:predicted alpha/beta-fold hydrolase
VENNEKRSQEAGDKLRGALLVVGLAGITAAYLVRGEAKSTWLAAAGLFGLSIGANIVSWFTLKAREIARQKAARAGVAPPVFSKWDLMSSWTWDSMSFAFIMVAALLLLLGFI